MRDPSPHTRPTPEPPQEPERELLEELTRVEHEIAALAKYRRQLWARLQRMQGAKG